MCVCFLIANMQEKKKMLLTLSVSKKSLSNDGKAKERPSVKKYWITVGVIAIIGMIVTLGYLVFTDTQDKAETQQNFDDCERLIDEGAKLTRKNNNDTNILNWSEEDQRLVLRIEDRYQTLCIPQKDDVLEKLKACTIYYITIQSLIDKMEVEDGGFRHASLPKDEQNAYDENYASYFGNYCDKVLPEILQSESYQTFNNTRSSSEEVTIDEPIIIEESTMFEDEN